MRLKSGLFILMIILINYSVGAQVLSEWKIKAVLPSCDYSVSDLDDRYVGGIIKLSHQSISFNNLTAEVVRIYYDSWTSSELHRETSGTASNGIDFNSINFSGEEILVLHVLAKGFPFPGQTILFLNADSAITMYNGVYYLLERIE